MAIKPRLVFLSCAGSCTLRTRRTLVNSEINAFLGYGGRCATIASRGFDEGN